MFYFTTAAGTCIPTQWGASLKPLREHLRRGIGLVLVYCANLFGTYGVRGTPRGVP